MALSQHPVILLFRKKTRFKINRDNFTLPSGAVSFLNSGTIVFQSIVTLSTGIFIATIAGVYCVTCKLRLLDRNTKTPEIQWYLRATNGFHTVYENLKMLLPAGVRGRRAGMNQCLVTLSIGQGVLPRNDLPTVAGCAVTFEGVLVQ